MPTVLQTGKFAEGQWGYPLLIELDNFDAAEWAGITGMALSIFRPDGTSFDVTLDPQIAIVGTSAQYITQDGDCPIDGHYAFCLTLTWPGKVLPVSGTFDIDPVEPS
ncbi:MAG TPA: hypothetical protein VKE42_10450 [Candidatus Cybelea sp.]|nr:hypothetical protein [Candidatus Cybelea sp.]